MTTGNTSLYSTNYYCQSVPDSHWYTDLKQIVYSIEYDLKRKKEESNPESQTRYGGEPLTKEHIIIGLNNSIKHGYKLKPTFKEDIKVSKTDIFISIEQMLEYVGGEDFTFDGFLSLLHATIENEVNMTNGLKLDRRDVYKRIDSERNYQDFRWNTNLREGDVPDEEKPVAEWLNYIEFHLLKAKNSNYHWNKEASLAELRKVAALAVRAMEIHGCPERKGVMLDHNSRITDTNGVMNNGGETTATDDVMVWNGEAWINKTTGKPVNRK
jgi:hypothetical protein